MKHGGDGGMTIQSMNDPLKTAKRDRELPLELIKRQRSHILFALSEAKEGKEDAFLTWYCNAYRKAVRDTVGVLAAQHYDQHEVDITQGHHAPLPFRYLGIHEISVDGAEAASDFIELVTTLHRQQPAAQPPATWLYYPVSEKVGRAPAQQPSLLTLAFANPVEGQDAEFREWYATRHIRHAMNVPALVSGQCFGRTLFQRPGALEAKFQIIALYEQEGTPESILESFASLPAGTLDFPALNVARGRFAEAVYRPI
jgi:hypothetical protein